MSIYGYCRISTPQQNIERQIRNILAQYPQAILYQEIYTGTKIYERSQWNKLYKKVKAGDTIIFDSVSRMSRDASLGFALYQELFEKGVELVFLKEPHINTTTYKKALQNNINMTGTKTDIILKAINEYLMELAKEQIKVAFEQSEKEVMDLHQRTKEGMLTAKLNGKTLGAPKGKSFNIKKKKPVMEIIKKKSKDFYGHNNDLEVMAILDKGSAKVINENGKEIEISTHVSRHTYYKYKKELFLLTNAQKSHIIKVY